MNGKTTLCIDTVSLKNPSLVGLSGEDIASQDWLDVYSTAAAARNAINSGEHQQDVWVVSSDDMEGINLAAALKRDNSLKNVELVSFGGTGSEVGRCEAAGIGLIRGKSEFVKRYSEQKTKQAFQDTGVAQSDAVIEDEASEFDDLLIEEPPVYKTAPQAYRYRDDLRDAQEASANAGQKAVKVVSSNRKESSHSVSSSIARSGFVVSVLSGNGGVGKSTIAACLAILMQRCGYKTVLLDFDLQFGDAGFLLGMDGVLGVDELLAQPGRITQVEPKDGLPAAIGAPGKLEHSEAVAGHASHVIDLLKSHFDAVIVNTGSFWSDSHIQIIESSDQVLFVLDQRPSSVRSCSRALDLCARCGIAIQPFRFILNQCSKHALLTAMDVSCALHGIQVAELKDGGREVGELLGAGLPLELIDSKNPFIESLKELIDALSLNGAGKRITEGNAIQIEKKPLFGGLRKRRTA